MEWKQGTLTSWKYPQKSCRPLGVLAPNRYWLDYQMIWYYSNTQLKRLQSYGPSKLAINKYSRPFGFEATFSVSLHSESLLSGQPGFDSRWAPTLRSCNFDPSWSKRTYNTSFERSNIFLLLYVKKMRFGEVLGHIKLVWITLEL